MKKLAISFILILAFSTYTPLIYSDPPTVNIPPTNAFDKVRTTSGSVYATNFSMPLIIQGLGSISVTANNNTHTIQISSSSSGAGTGSYNETLANGVLINSNGFQINFINGTGNPVHVQNSAGGNAVNVTISSVSSSGQTLDTIQCIGVHGECLYFGNNTNTNFEFKNILGGQGIAVTGNNSNVIISTNFKVNTQSCSAGFYMSSYSNSTGSFTCTSVSFSTGNVFKSKDVTCTTGFFVTNFNNQTGTYSCASVSTSTGIQFKSSTLTCGAGTFFSAFDNTTGTYSCATPAAITSINSQTGPAFVIHGGTRHNTVVTNQTNAVSIESNNTAYARNIFSNSGTSGGSGSGVYLNNTNTTLINLKSILSRNSYTLVTSNNTNVILNSSVPTSNVVDIYDTTFTDYTQPSTAVATSTGKCCVIPILGVTNGSTTTQTAGWNTFVWVQRNTNALTSGDLITSVGVNVNTAAGNIRVKVYQNDGTGGAPSTLLGESASTPVSSTGAFNVTVSATVPASGIVWVGFETDSATLSLKYNTLSTAKQCHVTHTYGTGPSPFGACTGGTAQDFKYYINYKTSPKATNTVDGNTATFWESNSVVNPAIYVDMSSAQVLSACAVYWNGSSTSTQIIIRTSNDLSNWNLKRTVNTNLLTNAAWNYIRWDLDSTPQRYLEFVGTDVGAKQLSIYEIKILTPTTTTILLRHGHEFIDSTNATLPLNR